MSDVQRTGFIETLSPLVQTSTQTIATRLVINQHVYVFKENDDLWDGAELDRLIERNVLPKNTVLRSKDGTLHGHFVCEVTDPADYEAILSISAGYRPYQHPEQLERKVAEKSTIPHSRPAAASATKGSRRDNPPAKPNTPRPGVTALAVDPAAG